VIHLPDIAFGAEAWALVELDLPLGSPPMAPAAAAGGRHRLDPEGEPLAFADATLTLPPAVSMPGKRAAEDPLVVARQSELAAGKLLEQARAAAEYGDWNTVERLLPRPAGVLPSSRG
jgi:Ca-activated chloride channel family protein